MVGGGGGGKGVTQFNSFCFIQAKRKAKEKLNLASDFAYVVHMKQFLDKVSYFLLVT